MRNLVPVHRGCIRTADQCPSNLSTVVINEDGNPMFVYTDGEEGDNVDVFEKVGNEWKQWLNWPGDKIMSVLPGEPALFVLRNGNIVEATAEGAQIAGGLDTEIKASEWAPDGEVGIIVTQEKVLFLSRSLDPIGEHSFSDSDMQLSKHVSVGWGKRETQFQGRGARAARDPTMPEKVDTGLISSLDDQSVQISWRGDGEFVAVSRIQDGRRVIIVLTREGAISSVTEPVDYLSQLVAWKPSGAVIASVQTEPHRVVFFERNGLRRYEFDLTRKEAVKGLAWSFDSEILAVQFETCVELWTTKNYHWYRKQVLVSTTKQKSTEWIYWHPEKRTLLVGWGDVVETHSFTVNVFTGPTQPPLDDGTVAVIDGDTIKVTPLAKFNFPPPMSKSRFQVNNPIHVAVRSNNNSFAVTTPQGFYLHPEGKLQEYEGTPRQAAFFGDTLATLTDVNGKSVLRLDGVEQEGIPNIYLLKEGFYETNDGKVFDFSHKLISKFDKPCVNFFVSENCTFGLTEGGNLIACDPNPRVIARGVTSIALTDSYLLLTTTTLLKFIHLSQIEVPEDDAQNEQCREIERGSLLVTVVPTRMLVVLQAPRGNLETIYPRMLVLREVRKALDALNFKSAFASCRVHRIDLQLLYDYNSTAFEANVDKFLEIGEDSIDLFLSSLKPENVAESKYKETIQRSQEYKVKDVNHVCDIMLSHMTSTRNIITAHACKVPADLESALKACKSDKDIEHAIYLTDSETLYKTALSMYDLKLTLSVAQQSQKDPKEYLAFLRARDKENEFRRRFNIDELLKDRQKAAKHLVQSPDATDEEIIEYIERYKLHQIVLPLVEGERENKVLESYAYYLMDQAEYQTAGLNFEYLGLTEEALSAYVKCGDWRRALSLDNTKAEDLAESCIALKKFGDAAEIYNHHLHLPDLAIENYCKAYLFDDAILVDRNSELIEDGLREQFGVIQELLSDCKRQVPSQLRRLRELREKREAEQGYSVDALAGDMEDNMSIAGTETTNASYVTRYTDKTGGTAQTGASRRTQKNRRREERKKARGKKGTVYEEEYLIASMGRLMERVEVTRPEAQRLVEALIRRHMRTYAVQVKGAYSEVLALIEENVTEFYTVAEADLVRYDADGNKFMADAPVPPPVPGKLI